MSLFVFMYLFFLFFPIFITCVCINLSSYARVRQVFSPRSCLSSVLPMFSSRGSSGRPSAPAALRCITSSDDGVNLRYNHTLS